MTYLLDTNVISELRKSPSKAEPAVRAWVAEQDPATLFLSAITILEIELGIARKAQRDPQQAAVFRTWLEGDVLPRFSGRILPLNVDVARVCARLHVPEPRSEADAMIGATAIVNDLEVVTRNVKDFDGMGVGLVNPWI